MDRHSLPLSHNSSCAALWQTRRPLGPATSAASAVIIFLIGSALCGMAQNLPELIAFRIVQGLGGRRAYRHCGCGRRRHRAAPRTWPLSGLLWRHIRNFDSHRSAAWWIHRRPSLLALDIFHQPAVRPSGAGGHQRQFQTAPACFKKSRDRLRRRRAACTCSRLHHHHHKPGRRC